MSKNALDVAPVGFCSYNKVRLFLLIAGLPSGQLVDLHNADTERAMRLIREEMKELEAAIAQFNESKVLAALTPVADAIIDLEIVLHNLTYDLGLPYLALFNAVHESNMAKLSHCPACAGLGCPECKYCGRIAILNEHRKIMKPAGWKAPDLDEVLRTTYYEQVNERWKAERTQEKQEGEQEGEQGDKEG